MVACDACPRPPLVGGQVAPALSRLSWAMASEQRGLIPSVPGSEEVDIGKLFIEFISENNLANSPRITSLIYENEQRQIGQLF